MKPGEIRAGRVYRSADGSTAKVMKFVREDCTSKVILRNKSVINEKWTLKAFAAWAVAEVETGKTALATVTR